MSAPKGFPTNRKTPLPVAGQTNAYVTVVPVDPYRHALDVNRFAFRVGSPTVPRTAGVNTGNPSEGPTFIHDPGTPARIGDFVRFEDGNAQFLELSITAIAAGNVGFYLALDLESQFIPSPGNTFYIMRYTTQRVDDTGSQIVVATPGPSQFVLDGNDVEVEEDTVDPTNNKPLPTKVFNASLDPINPATEETLTSIDTKTPPLAAGRVPVDGSGVTQPVSAASLPLPSGASTEATLLAFSAKSASSLVTVPYDYQDISYIVAGNGAGEIGVILYRSGGPSGSIVAQLMLAYDSSNRLISVEKV